MRLGEDVHVLPTEEKEEEEERVTYKLPGWFLIHVYTLIYPLVQLGD